MGGRCCQPAAGPMCSLLAGRHQRKSGKRSSWRWIARAFQQILTLGPATRRFRTRMVSSFTFLHTTCLLLTHFIRLGPRTAELLPATHLVLTTLACQPVCLDQYRSVAYGTLEGMSCNWWLRLANVIIDLFRWFWTIPLFRHSLLQHSTTLGHRPPHARGFAGGR